MLKRAFMSSISPQVGMYSMLTRFLLLVLWPLSAMLASQSSARIITSKDGTIIYADATGNPAKQSIIFVHGLALSGAVFDNFFTNGHLRENYYLVRYLWARFFRAPC